jgi:hypothetical protein
MNRRSASRFSADEGGQDSGRYTGLQVTLEVATHLALNTGAGIPGLGDCLVFGSQIDFSLEKLLSLYGDRSGYQQQVEQRLGELIEQGWFLAEFADEIRSAAAEFDGFAGNGG